jgi:Papain family cysteine protease
MKRRRFLSAVSASGASTYLTACGGGGSSATTTAPVQTLGLAIPDPLEVAGRLPAYNKDYSDGRPLPRSVDNSANCPPVGDQGRLASCVGWTVGYGLGSYVNAVATSTKPTTPDKQASPGDLYTKLLQASSIPCGNGTFLKVGMNIMAQRGINSIQAAPYSDNTCTAASNSTQFRIKSFQSLRPTDSVALKRELASGKVIAIGSAMTSDILSITTQNYYATGNQLSGHAMLVVGYDDSRSAWRVLNSWGLNWGDRGYFWFDYSAFARVTFEACSPLLEAGPPRPSTNAAPTIAYSSGSSIYDTYYSEEYLYLYVEFTNVWLVQSYTIFKDGNPIETKTGVDQWMEGSYFIAKRAAALGSFPAGTYTIELKGSSGTNATTATTLNATIQVLSFVAKDPTEPVR